MGQVDLQNSNSESPVPVHFGDGSCRAGNPCAAFYLCQQLARSDFRAH
jgi:hypothetical protein